MKLHRLFIVVLAVVALTGCVTPAPAPAPATQAPAAETPAPVQEAPTAVPAAAQAESLTANPWQWVAFTGAAEQFEIAMPESYLLTFNEDGTVNIVADCNRAAGSYKTDAGSLTIEVGPATLALCPGDSRGEQFVTYLGSAARTFFQDGKLFIDLFADGGTMAFAPADPELLADDGEGAMAGAPVPSGAGQSADFSATALMNATYSGIFDEPVTLTDGLYEGQPFVAGDPARPTVHYGAGSERYGDLDGDGVEDAIVILIERSGGTGAFSYVAAQLNRDGQPVDAGAVRIEDRIGVKSAGIVDGQVMLEVIMQGPGDVACCGTHKTLKTYALQDGRLAEIAREGETLEKVSAADLAGTTWTLAELNYDQPALVEAEVTVTFQDGGISGSGGCNNYNASVTWGDVNPFVVTFGPVASTRMMCPEPISNQETAYFTALGTVGSWSYVYGRLAFFYVDEQGLGGRLLFAAQEAPELAPPPTEDLALLRAQPWQWVTFTGAIEQFDVTAPESYQLTFSADGTVNIVADCNRAAGSYMSDDTGSLTIQIGPATLALCPGDSRGEQFVKYLGSAARYFFQDGKLFIDLFADGGTLAFAPAD